jgi:hypothetical protein
MSIYIGYEKIQNNVGTVLQRLSQNAQFGILDLSDAPDTINKLVNTGIECPDAVGPAPYAGIGRELAAADGETQADPDTDQPGDVPTTLDNIKLDGSDTSTTADPFPQFTLDPTG